MYIYVVTRIIEGKLEDHTRNIPNLGVHTSFESAYRHYKAVVEDRCKHFNLRWNRSTEERFTKDTRCIVTNEAMITWRHPLTPMNQSDDVREIIRLEQWKVIK